MQLTVTFIHKNKMRTTGREVKPLALVATQKPDTNGHYRLPVVPAGRGKMIKKNKRLDIITRLADALAVNREPDAPKEMCASDIADLEALEAALRARVAGMSADQRYHVTNSAIDILRTNNAGQEAEAEVRRIMGV